MAISKLGMVLSQQKYIQDMLTDINMLCKPIDSPIDQNVSFNDEFINVFEDVRWYKSLIEKLIYLTDTRLDAIFAVSALNQFM